MEYAPLVFFVLGMVSLLALVGLAISIQAPIPPTIDTSKMDRHSS